MNVFLRWTLPTVLALHTSLAAAAARPNVVVIYADDLGYGDVQGYNPERGKIPTPRIDRLAAQGMAFTDAHSSSGVCSPSRYTLLTGRYHWRTRLQKGIVGVFGEPLIAPERLTVAGLLKQGGYRTACIGKWHLGWDWNLPEGKARLFHGMGREPEATVAHRAAWRERFAQPVGGGPVTRGFDEYFGTDVPNWPPYCFIENDRTVGIPSAFLPAPLLKDHQASQQGPALEAWSLENILPALADRACAFIESAAREDRPFFLYLPLTSPHTPLAVQPAWKGRSGLGAYADFVMQTDAAVGHVLEALDKSGAAERTLVVFTSDNGCAPYVGAADMEAKGHFPSGPLRGYKADAWEGGHRVPFIVRWPGVVEAGRRCGQLVHQADLMATVADAAGVEVPAGAGEDSVSLLPLLKGFAAPVREGAVSCSSGGLFAVRKGPWKLILGKGSGGWGKGGDDQPRQLYNLDDDLGERKNRYGEMPEKAEELAALLRAWVDKGRSTPGPAGKNDVPVRMP
jgi:arylsulfatase A-like enzyme